MAASRPSVKQVVNAKGEVTVEKVRVQRYFAGKAPSFAEGDDDDESGLVRAPVAAPGTAAAAAAPVAPAALSAADVQSDARLRRLMQSRAEHRAVFEGEVVRRRHREVESEPAEDDSQVQPVRAPAGEDEEEDEEERRQRLRLKARQQRLQEEEELARRQEAEAEEAARAEAEAAQGRAKGRGDNDEGDEGDEDEEDEDEDDEDDDLLMQPIKKPVFVPKSERITVVDKAKEELDAIQAEKEKQLKQEMRRQETYQIVAEEIKRALDNQPVDASAMIATPDAVDDSDDLNEEEEYEQWKLRELKRIKRDKEEDEKFEIERRETERRSKLTDAERKAEDALIKEKQRPAEKAKYRFLQKYYHRGAFYQDQEVLKTHDFAEPTERDMINKELLPKVMQVKNFGRSSQTKYTHLLDQDTSKDGAVWAQKTAVNARATQRLAGYATANSFDKPGSKRKR